MSRRCRLMRVKQAGPRVSYIVERRGQRLIDGENTQ